MSHARRALSGRKQKSAPRRRGNARRSRPLHEVERLELRALMAGDTEVYMPYHNYFYAEDVNFDFTVTPLDALLIINEINTHGPRELAPAGSQGGQGEQSSKSYLDVNGDGFLSPIDAVSVINLLNSPQGESTDAVLFRTKIVDTEGLELPKTGAGTSNDPYTYTISKGDTFGYSIQIKDNRPQAVPFDNNALGIFATFMDLTFNPSVAKLGLSETQSIKLSNMPTGTSATKIGDLNIDLGSYGNVNVPILRGADRQGTNASAIGDALDGLLGGPGSAIVTNSGDTFTVKFGNKVLDVNMPLMNLTWTGSIPAFDGVVPTVEQTASQNLTNNDPAAALKAQLVEALNYSSFPKYSAVGDPTEGSQANQRVFD
ncbi:MAG TPA: dockerin type I domain-containing protein, partial [Pirellulaceae bacterium]|nr:dockerin type I domain-containing protein [Pirellulaceae bacterium]